MSPLKGHFQESTLTSIELTFDNFRETFDLILHEGDEGANDDRDARSLTLG